MRLKAERDDVLPDGRAPRNYRQFLRDFGGVNPYGEANYRLVRAEHVLITLGNLWTDWPEGTPIEEQDGLIFSDETTLVETFAKIKESNLTLKQLVEMPKEMLPSSTKPLRRVAEMRTVKRYPNITGWMLQHWDPPELYGSREKWEGPHVPGFPNLPMCGPYPERGRYEQTNCWTTIEDGQLRVHSVFLRELPPFDKLEDAMLARERKREANRNVANQDWVRLIAVNEVMQIYEDERRKFREFVRLYCKDKTKHLFGSSLESGRMRNEMAARAGITGHVGN